MRMDLQLISMTMQCWLQLLGETSGSQRSFLFTFKRSVYCSNLAVLIWIPITSIAVMYKNG